jgi:23S rRNA pseudouridine1911/1915/1917 synthase
MDSTENPAEFASLTVAEHESQMRLDSFLVSHFSQFSRAKLQRAVAKGNVKVDGQIAKASLKLKSGQTVSLTVPHLDSSGPAAEDIPLDIIFEDDHIVAINKPFAMVVHPAKGHWSGTLTAALAFHFNNLSSIGGPSRPGIVHRLDRDTSGVILIAKTDQAHSNLAIQFESRTVEKRYLAIVTPAPNRDRDLIEKPIGIHPYQREKMAIREQHKSSRPATTFYEVLQRFGEGIALLSVSPKTGRTHQIRVHLAHTGSPVLCDRLYSGRSQLKICDIDRRSGDQKILLARQALHAKTLEIDHPISGQRMKFEAELAADMRELIEVLQHLQ